MYYFRLPLILTVNDDDVASEINRLSRDELEFSKYVSRLVEKDLLRKVGKRIYDESQFVETDTTSISKIPNPGEIPYMEILSKLDAIISMGAVNPNSQVNPYVQQPQHNLNVDTPSSLSVDLPPVKHVVHEVDNVEAVNSQEEVAVPVVPKKKKKSKIGIKGKDAGSILSKMKSMQK